VPASRKKKAAPIIKSKPIKKFATKQYIPSRDTAVSQVIFDPQDTRTLSSAKGYRSASTRIADAAKNLITFTNPKYSDQELEYFEEAWSTTIAGTAIDKKMEFVLGGGVKPTFELIEDMGLDDEQKAKELEKYNDILDELIQFDEKLDFNKKLFDGAVMAKVFGRCVMTWEEGAKKLPKAIKIIHPRDTGRVILNQENWDIETVTTHNPSAQLTPEEMVYLVNKPDSPIRKNMWFGFSELQRVVGAARAYRRIVEFDIPEIATTMWAGYGMFLVKKMGKNQADSVADLNAILNSLKPGAFNAVSVEETDEIEYKELDLNPKVGEMVQLGEFYKNLLISNQQIPTALLGDEADQNRATLLGKIRFFIEGPVEADRTWLAKIIGPEWYERNLVKMGHKDILTIVRVKPEFDPIFVESWQDQIEGVQMLKGLFPSMPDEVLLQLLKLEEFTNELASSTKEVVTEEKKVAVANRGFQIQAETYLKNLNKIKKQNEGR